MGPFWEGFGVTLKVVAAGLALALLLGTLLGVFSTTRSRILRGISRVYVEFYQNTPLPVQVLEASLKGHYTQLVVQPLGWYNEPLTVVMHGDDAPQRGERLFVGLQHARLYNGDERIETRDEELALAQSA